MNVELRFEWDEEKAHANLRKHGVSFAKAARIFRHEIVTSVDDREEYGETRIIALGRVDQSVYRVIYTMRGETIRIISAWRAAYDDEERYYRELFA